MATADASNRASRHWDEKRPRNLGPLIATVAATTLRSWCTGSSLARCRRIGRCRKGSCSPRAELATPPNTARWQQVRAYLDGDTDIELHSMYERLMSETRGAARGGGR